MRLASCCSVEVRNGAAGRRVYGFSSTFSTVNGRPSSPSASERAVVLVEHEDCRRRGSVLCEVAALRDSLSVERVEACLERAGLERAEDVPVGRRDESHALPLAIDDESRRDRLDTAGREPWHDLLPEDRRHLVAVEAVEDPPCLLGVDESIVDRARLLERTDDRVLRDLVEDHALDGDLRLQHLDEMPRDRLALAILVRREQELVGVGEALLEVGDDLLLVGVDDVVRLESVVDVDAERSEPLALRLGDVLRAIREVANVARRSIRRRSRRRGIPRWFAPSQATRR